MVFGVRPVRVLINVPITVPSTVQLAVRSGFSVVFQQTPSAVSAAPPSEMTVPPLTAVVAVIFEIDAVVTVGRLAVEVEKARSFP